ncbi:hypothetical protein EJB05_12732, partial [Eragrostis curvula]
MSSWRVRTSPAARRRGHDDKKVTIPSTVILRHMFTPAELRANEELLPDLEADVTEECIKIGPGVILVEFKDRKDAAKCIEKMNGTWPDLTYDRFLVMCRTFDTDDDLAGNERAPIILPEHGLCDPVTCEFTLLPPVPAGFLASTLGKVQDDNMEFFYPFFDPLGCYDDEAQFRVICWTLSEEMAVVFVYSSASGSWTHGASATWAALDLDVQPGEVSCVSPWPSYAYGCLYWHAGVSDDLIKLDVNSMEISIVPLPSDHEDNQDIVLVEAGEGKIGMFSRIGSHPEHLRYSIRQNVSGDPNEPSVRTVFILLPREYDIYFMDGVAQGYHA